VQADWTGIVGTGFLVWGILSVVHQYPPRWLDYVLKYDCFRLLPQWYFFAPRPSRRDDHLVFRDLVDGRPGDWREVDVGEARMALRWLWNPWRFRQKALMDLANGLLKTRLHRTEHELDERSEQLSLAYLGLLAWVSAQRLEHSPCRRQFALVSSSGHGPDRTLRIIYVSEAHRVADADGG
jgi:hypothetical protein